jgi:hypothetical protein
VASPARPASTKPRSAARRRTQPKAHRHMDSLPRSQRQRRHRHGTGAGDHIGCASMVRHSRDTAMALAHVLVGGASPRPASAQHDEEQAQ